MLTRLLFVAAAMLALPARAADTPQSFSFGVSNAAARVEGEPGGLAPLDLRLRPAGAAAHPERHAGGLGNLHVSLAKALAT